MTQQRVIYGFGGGAGGSLLITLGGIFIASGILIAVFPQILVALIAGLIIFAGITLVGTGLAARRAARHLRDEVVGEYEVIEP